LDLLVGIDAAEVSAVDVSEGAGVGDVGLGFGRERAIGGVISLVALERILGTLGEVL